MRVRPLLAALIVLAILASPAAAAPTASDSPFCAPGQTPSFQFGFADLKALIGDPMGSPVECEHPQPDSGDILQRTSTGLAVYRKCANMPTFTDGYTKWALTTDGLYEWQGASDWPVGEAPPPIPSACIPALPSPYSSAAIWAPYDSSHMAAVQSSCGVDDWFALNLDKNPQDKGCVELAMRSTGATNEAVQFFESTKEFLFSFQELGPIDLGGAVSPWVNMGRGEMVFLNGTPSAIDIFDVFPYQTWQAAPGYAQMDSDPWPEYGWLDRSEILSDGSQLIRIDVPMKRGRPGAVLAVMPADFTFDRSGRLSSIYIAPPTAPPSPQ